MVSLVDKKAIPLVYIVEAYPLNPENSTVEPLLLSTRRFFTRTAQYKPRLLDPYSFSRFAWSDDLELGGFVETDFGKIVVDNTDGFFDYLLFYAWKGRKVQVFYGLDGDDRASFTMLFEGKVVSVSASDSEFTIEIEDRKQELDDTLQVRRFLGTGDGDPSSIDGTSDLQDKFIPVCFGEVYGVPLLLINPSTLIYRFHDGQASAVLELRDDDVVLQNNGNVSLANIQDPGFGIPNGQYVTHLELGLVRLGASPVGTVNADLQGGKWQLTIDPPQDQNNQDGLDPDPGVPSGQVSYAAKPAEQVIAILHYYGKKPIARNLASFDAFSLAVSAKTGFYLGEGQEKERADVLSALVAPFGYWFAFDNDGLCEVIPLVRPDTVDASYELGVDDIMDVPVVKSYTAPWSSVDITFRNDLRRGAGFKSSNSSSVQWETEQVASLIDPNVWLESVRSQIETLCVERSDAADVGNLWLSFYDRVRLMLVFELKWNGYGLVAGSVIRIKYPRFGLDDGRNFVITKLSYNGKEDKMELTVWG